MWTILSGVLLALVATPTGGTCIVGCTAEDFQIVALSSFQVGSMFIYNMDNDKTAEVVVSIGTPNSIMWFSYNSTDWIVGGTAMSSDSSTSGTADRFCMGDVNLGK